MLVFVFVDFLNLKNREEFPPPVFIYIVD